MRRPTFSTFIKPRREINQRKRARSFSNKFMEINFNQNLSTEFYYLLANRMEAQPEYHAKIELTRTGDGWFYGYRIDLKESFSELKLCNRLGDGRRKGEVSKSTALIFALDDIIKKTPGSFGGDLDEDAIAGALRDEARAHLVEVSRIALIQDRTLIFNDAACRVRLSYALPKEYRRHLKIEEITSFAGDKQTGGEQLSLF